MAGRCRQVAGKWQAGGRQMRAGGRQANNAVDWQMAFGVAGMPAMPIGVWGGVWVGGVQSVAQDLLREHSLERALCRSSSQKHLLRVPLLWYSQDESVCRPPRHLQSQARLYFPLIFCLCLQHARYVGRPYFPPHMPHHGQAHFCANRCAGLRVHTTHFADST